MYALAETFEAAHVNSNDLKAIHKTVVPIDLFLDSKQVLGAVMKSHKTAKKNYDLCSRY